MPGCDPSCRHALDHGRMRAPLLIEHPEAAQAALALSLAVIAGAPAEETLGRFPWLRSALAAWHTPVAELRRLGEGRAWALADAPDGRPRLAMDALCVDACDVLHHAELCRAPKAGLVDLADLSARLAAWSGLRLAWWHRQVQQAQVPLHDRQSVMQWIAPLERRLRDELILMIWRHSLQGEILPSPAFATGHAWTMPIVRWVLAPRSPARRLQRRAAVAQCRSLIGLLLALAPVNRLAAQAGLRSLARLCRTQRRPRRRAIAKALAPCLEMPAWAVRRVMALEAPPGALEAEATLADLRRLSHQVPARAWPHGLASLQQALRCLRALDGMLCFGLVDCEAWPEDQALPPRPLKWLLRELRVGHGGDWARLACALEGQTPRYQLFQPVLRGLADSFCHRHEDEPDVMERISAPWRHASPAWWLERLQQWRNKVQGLPAGRRGLHWRPLFPGLRPFGRRLVGCLDSARQVQQCLARHGLEPLLTWLGQSLMARVQWLVLMDARDRQAMSLAVLHATTRRGHLQVTMVAHLRLPGEALPAVDCVESLRQLQSTWEAAGWGVLARVEHEQVLTEDEELCSAIEATRIRVWRAMASIGCKPR